jgi:hypothetical protein
MKNLITVLFFESIVAAYPTLSTGNQVNCHVKPSVDIALPFAGTTRVVSTMVTVQYVEAFSR